VSSHMRELAVLKHAGDADGLKAKALEATKHAAALQVGAASLAPGFQLTLFVLCRFYFASRCNPPALC